MPTFAEFFKNLAVKSGVELNDEVTGLLSNEQLAQIEIPETIAKGIDNNIISLRDAKNNHPEIKNWYQKQALDTVDTGLVAMMEDFGIDEAVRNEVLQERSTYKRIPLLVKKVRELEAKKAGATSQTDKTALQKQIDELQAQLRAKTAQESAMKAEFDNKVKQFKIQYKLNQLLSQYSTIYDNPTAPLDPEVKAMTLQNLLNRDLQAHNATIDFDENDNLVLLKKEGGNYYGENNQQVTPQNFAEQMLSRNKLLSVTPPTTGASANQKPGQAAPTTPLQNVAAAMQQPQGGQGGAQGVKGNNTLKALVQESMQQLNDSNKVPIM